MFQNISYVEIFYYRIIYLFQSTFFGIIIQSPSTFLDVINNLCHWSGKIIQRHAISHYHYHEI